MLQFPEPFAGLVCGSFCCFNTHAGIVLTSALLAGRRPEPRKPFFNAIAHLLEGRTAHDRPDFGFERRSHGNAKRVHRVDDYLTFPTRQSLRNHAMLSEWDRQNDCVGLKRAVQ
ncbi:hypothetical protein [Acidiphilium sp. JA12-A1]|uniref:hypothetical protein n=1 Tax=Acidiphilium sp. JA12-A1 TaxID=1464546 RepID=UPI00068BEEDB|nr:hypothetical protein [Acidiphilium sp. JA12-A1]